MTRTRTLPAFSDTELVEAVSWTTSLTSPKLTCSAACAPVSGSLMPMRPSPVISQPCEPAPKLASWVSGKPLSVTPCTTEVPGLKQYT